MLFSGSVFISSCSRSEGKSVEKAESYKVIQPLVLDTSYQEEYVAEIHARQKVELRTRLKGFIEQIHVDEGQAVSAGQLLFTLSSRNYRDDLLKANAQLKSATAELKSVDVELKNTKLLVDKNVVSRSELEMVQAKKESVMARIEEANSSISIAQLHLSYTQIRAPFSGVINRIPNKRGSLVEEGTLLTTLSDHGEVFAYFNFSEADYMNFMQSDDSAHKGEVSLRLANHNLYDHRGKIEVSESEFDHSSGNIAFRARFPNPDGLLKHGSNAKIIVDKPLHQVMMIPQRSTFEIQDKLFVYVVDANNIIRQRNIITGKRLPHYYTVTSGINADERIVYEGLENLKDGQPISPKKVDLPKDWSSIH